MTPGRAARLGKNSLQATFSECRAGSQWLDPGWWYLKVGCDIIFGLEPEIDTAAVSGVMTLHSGAWDTNISARAGGTRAEPVAALKLKSGLKLASPASQLQVRFSFQFAQNDYFTFILGFLKTVQRDRRVPSPMLFRALANRFSRFGVSDRETSSAICAASAATPFAAPA